MEMHKKDKMSTARKKEGIGKRRKKETISSERFVIELARAIELTGLPLYVSNFPLGDNDNRHYVLNDTSEGEYVISRAITKLELYEGLFVHNHVLEKMQKLGRTQKNES
jgi:hypothetical protein